MAFFLLLDFIVAGLRNIVKYFREIFWLFCNATYYFIEQSCIDIQFLLICHFIFDKIDFVQYNKVIL
ncbi:hypothetical protein MITSMUL_04139 [Mitsuokella multacida DSM 20544]|uniref:Uncharacterized protein n=1 Tax=Mitsuokella multacida DSM 20544 TaxID=500635 RepID=C9KLQ5_9FIRM|nr:hypothetical protein MITSMUL_04139 [Mitsuokella multacida DSM 20544]